MFFFRFTTRIHILIVGSVLFCTPGRLAECPSEFKGMCQCGYERFGEQGTITYVTNCTDTNFETTAMLKKLPPETEVLIFVGNTIKDLPLNIFDPETVFQKLHSIDLSNNKIQTIKGKTFHNVANVQKLVLNDNDIYITSKDYHPRMFSNFIKLQELHLKNAFTEKVKSVDYLSKLAGIFENSDLKDLRVLNVENNEIAEISPNEFCSLPFLEELYMADNRLRDISLNFSCLPKLNKLDLGRNRISYLANKTMAEIEKVEKLQLTLIDNPFICDCHMLDTYKWMNTTKADLNNKNELYCMGGFPPNKGKRIFAVPVSEYKCITAPTKGPLHTSTVRYLILVLGITILTIVIALLAYKNRKQVSKFMSRLTQPVRNKFQYVSLDRRDVTIEV